ncbi:MAG: biosynthetic arginine decarboxylase [Planctomycetota bacterium]|nr:biosynthetic arginine decarboxylase [Planctomycetota bacterium]
MTTPDVSFPASTDAQRESPARGCAVAPATEPAWSTEDSVDLYQTRLWGKGFFDVNAEGHVVVRPERDPVREIDLHAVVEGLRERGFKTPVLIHFSDLLNRRMADLHEAFQNAIRENTYRGAYIGVYPIKVNQQRRVVEEIRQYGEAFNSGLEVGSKPELLAVMGLTTDSRDRLIICNGFKEDRYIEFTMLAAKLGRQIIPVIENLTELRLILSHADRLGVRPRIGVRVNLSAKGAGRWRHSSGAKAKFGLTLLEVLEVFEVLKARKMEDCLELLHCHMGSQIHDIRQVVSGVNELARIYVQLRKMGAGVQFMDVGGGLGVDYDGSQTSFEFSTNYTLQEYASSIVYKIMAVCDEEGVDHPTIITESGRAMVAQQSVLVFDVLGANRPDRHTPPAELPPLIDGEAAPRPLTDMWETFRAVNERRLVERYHDALEARDEAMRLFSVGYMGLQARAMVDQLFWATCAKIRDKVRELGDNAPEELAELESSMSDTYFCNLSIFQSLPDIWAIRQLFPIMPIHRLNEHPSRRATLADITCDSDGKIDRFVDDHDVKKSLQLHDFQEGESYLLGAFLVGAYQETLGDLHNLFGDTHAAHVRLDENGQWWLDEVIEGDSVREVLQYVQYDPLKLSAAIRRECELAVRDKRMAAIESQKVVRAYEAGLDGYTYLESGESPVFDHDAG